MRINFNRLSGVLVIVVAASGFHGAAIAQSTSSTQPHAAPTLADKFEQTYFSNDPNFFRNRSIGRQLNWLFGINGFSENEINRDAAQLHKLFESSLKQQTTSDPVIRTRDLPNPYDSSILTSPNIQVQPSSRSELIFEK